MINLTKSKAINTLLGQIVLIYVFTLLTWIFLEPVIEVYFFALDDFQIKGVKSLLPFGLVLAIAIRQEPPLLYVGILCLAAAIGVFISIIWGPMGLFKFCLGFGALLLLALMFVRLGDI